MSEQRSFTAGNFPARRKSGRGFPAWLPAGALILLGALGLSAAMLAHSWAPSRSNFDLVYGQPMWAMHASMHGGNGSMTDFGAMRLESDRMPAAELDEQFFDFGALGAGQREVSHSFTLANRGDAPLLIMEAYSTCGCVRAEISAAVIPPGKAGLITVYFSPTLDSGRSAAIRRGIILETNDPLHPQIELWVQAAVSRIKSE